MADQEPREDIGHKGGAAEGYAGHMYYEPTVTAVTDITIPPDRVQWGPTLAGVVVALALTFWWISLGVAIGLGIVGMGYWTIAFTALDLFIGSMLAARTAKTMTAWPAALHGLMVWSVFTILYVLGAGSIGGGILASSARLAPGGGPHAAAIVSGIGWWFFIGFVILLAASVLGGIAGVGAARREEEVHEVHT